MKKIIALMFILMMSMFSTANAEEIRHVEVSRLPKTYVWNEEASLFSAESDLEARLVSAWDKFEEVVNVRDLNIDIEDIELLYEKIFFHNPKYFYVEPSYSYTMSKDKYSGKYYVIDIFQDYNTTDSKVIKETMEEIEEEANAILMNIDIGMTDFEKVMAVHDYMVLNYQYDMSYTVYDITVMTKGYGVCMAYSIAFNYIMDLLGIESTYVSSVEMDHAWNLVKIDGEWYHIDVTWDDPTQDKYAQVTHTFALHSTESITGLSEEHVGFDTGDIIADSTRFDDAHWHDSKVHSAIVYANGKTYWIEDNKLVCEDGQVVYDKLDGGDGYWHTSASSGFKGSCYSGLASYENRLYFNTDSCIYCYDTITGDLTVVLEEFGICGMYVDEDELEYGRYNKNKKNFENAGEIHLGDLRVSVRTDKYNNLVVGIINETDKHVNIYCSDGNTCFVDGTDDDDHFVATFPGVEGEQTIFIWNHNMKPLRPKRTVLVEK